MAIQSIAANKIKFNDPATGLLKDNATNDIEAIDLRAVVDDLSDSNYNKVDNKYNGPAGIGSEVTTIAGLKAVPTAGGKILANNIAIFQDTGSSNALRAYRFRAGTDAESSPDILRPNDFNSSTNAFVWVLSVVGTGGGGSITSVNGDFGPTVNLIASEIPMSATGGLSSTDVQAGLAELDTEKATVASVTNKISITGSEISATASGTNTYTATLSPTPAYATGLIITIKFTNANSGASTINLNSLGAKGIKKNVSIDLASGDIAAGAVVVLVYDGTNFQAIGIATAAGGVTSVNGDSGPTVNLIASEIPNTPAGNIASTDVQGALNELDTEKATTGSVTLKVAKSGDSMTGALAMGTNKITGLAAATAAGDALRYEQVYTDFVTLTDGATTTWDTTGLQGPIAKWTMGATARTLAMTNLKSGASGLLVVKTGVSGAITLTFPSGSVTDAGSLTTYIFPAGINVFYDLTWYYDGATSTIKWIIGVSNIDTDGTFAANSDLVVPSQKAAKTYVDTVTAGVGSITKIYASQNFK